MMQADGLIATAIDSGQFDGIVLDDAVGLFDRMLSMMVNLMMDCADTSIFE